MGQSAMIIDYKYCTGCHVCEVACRQEKNIPLEEWGIKLTEIGPQKMGGKWEWDYVPVPTDLCDLCAGVREKGNPAPCVKHCLAFCMEIVPIEQVSERLASLGNKTVVYVPKNA